MSIIHFLIGFIIGGIVGAWLLIQVLIIFVFGIPFSIQLKRREILTSLAPVGRYIISSLLLLSVFGVAAWLLQNYYPQSISGFATGTIFALLLGLGGVGANEANLSDYFRTNAKYINHEALARYSDYSSGF